MRPTSRGALGPASPEGPRAPQARRSHSRAHQAAVRRLEVPVSRGKRKRRRAAEGRGSASGRPEARVERVAESEPAAPRAGRGSHAGRAPCRAGPVVGGRASAGDAARRRSPAGAPDRDLCRTAGLRQVSPRGRGALTGIAPRPCDAAGDRGQRRRQLRQCALHLRGADLDVLPPQRRLRSADGCPDGTLGDYEVKYTFCTAPLQQYFVAR
jgi:hypothetical protein